MRKLQCFGALDRAADPSVHAGQVLPRKEMGRQLQTGVTGEGEWGEGGNVDAKRPTGSISHGVCSLRGSCLTGEYMPGFDCVYQ